MPAKGGDHLGHFFREGYYKNNKTYLNAWCNHCVDAHAKSLSSKGVLEHVQGTRAILSTKMQLKAQGTLSFAPCH